MSAAGGSRAQTTPPPASSTSSVEPAGAGAWPGDAGGAVARHFHSAILPSMSRVLRLEPLCGGCTSGLASFVFSGGLFFVFVEYGVIVNARPRQD